MKESINDHNDQEINTREADTEDITNQIEQLCSFTIRNFVLKHINIIFVSNVWLMNLLPVHQQHL